MKSKFLTNPETVEIVKKLLKESDKVDLAVSYLKISGYKLIEDEIIKLVNKGIKIRAIVDLDLNLQITDIEPIIKIKKLGSNIGIKVYKTNNNNFHPKLYIFYNGDKVSIIIGSSNITRGGLINNIEANLFIESEKDDDLVKNIMDYFNILWGDSLIPDDIELSSYDELRKNRKKTEVKIKKSPAYKKLSDFITAKINKIKESEKRKYWLFPKRTFKQEELKKFEKYDGLEWKDVKKDLMTELKLTQQSVGTMEAEYEDFGFLVIGIKNNKSILELTDVGKEYLKSNKPEEIILKQCLKWQFPNPEQNKVGGIRVFPFVLILGAIKELGYLTNEEIALFLFKVESMNQDDFDVLISRIRDYRKLNDEEKKNRYGEPLLQNMRYLTYISTFFIQSDIIQKDRNKLLIDKTKMNKADNILGEYKDKQVKDYTLDEYHKHMGSL
ncbi:MAG: phospholipase D-like domain-containing protein [Nanoarchaeota archaeon]